VSFPEVKYTSASRAAQRQDRRQEHQEVTTKLTLKTPATI